MISTEDLNELINKITENIRASSIAGLDFVDTRNFRSGLITKQNHVIFGRRGAGKTTLISSFDNDFESAKIIINMEAYKDITFPNIIISVLIEALDQLILEIKRLSKWYQFKTSKKSEKLIVEAKTKLESLLNEPDVSTEDQTETRNTETAVDIMAGNQHIGAGASKKNTTGRQVSRSIDINKLERLKKDLQTYTKLFDTVSLTISNKTIYIILDDFYFLPKSTQVDFIDYFHRLTKGTGLYLKIATIRHRTNLYKRTKETYIGTEVGHDIYPIDMDYTLDKFEDLQQFMRQLFDNACQTADVSIDIEDLFQGDGFQQLCLASGGVPRDFLTLLADLAHKVASGEIEKIGKRQVNEASINNRQNKMVNLKLDSAEDNETLEHHLNYIKDYIYGQKRTNVFLVAKQDLEEFPQERQAIKELLDLRFLHLIDSNTSKAPSDGRRYEAYMLDTGLYDNAQPRNFNQLEPGSTDERSRKDKLRASPQLDLQLLKDSLDETSSTQPLVITE